MNYSPLWYNTPKVNPCIILTSGLLIYGFNIYTNKIELSKSLFIQFMTDFCIALTVSDTIASILDHNNARYLS